jgi:putative glutamine amidotransferase
MSRFTRALGLAAALSVITLSTLLVGYEVWFLTALRRQGPVIGVSTDHAWHARLGITTTSYEIAVTRAGGRPYMFRHDERSPEEILDRIDALLLAGGGDVHPATYGGEGVAAELTSRARDEFELELIRGAIERDMPILGICRGTQILNVAHGGNLTAIRDHDEVARFHGSKLHYLDHTHPVTVAGDSRLARVVGAGARDVDSYHGQAIDRLGERLVPVATAPDGIVEAVERRDRAFVVAVQWHPELLSLTDSEDLRPFQALVEAAREYAAESEER